MTTPLTAEIDRLRAENAELRAALQLIARAPDGKYQAEYMQAMARVALAKVQP